MPQIGLKAGIQVSSYLRLYFAKVKDKNGDTTLLILGSGKGNEQNKAINESRKILKRYSIDKGDIRKKDQR